MTNAYGPWAIDNCHGLINFIFQPQVKIICIVMFKIKNYIPI